MNTHRVDDQWVGILNFHDGRVLRATRRVGSRARARALASQWLADATAAQLATRSEEAYFWVRDPEFLNFANWHICVYDKGPIVERPILLS